MDGTGMFFVIGLLIGLVASHGFIPAEQHDARGITILACLVTAVLVGWTVIQLEAPRAVAWLGAVLGSAAVGRRAVVYARVSANQRPDFSRRPIERGMTRG